MLSLVGAEIESSGSAFRKTKGTTQARREQQAREQRETASSWLDPAISHIRRSDGKKHPIQLCRGYSGKASLARLRLLRWRDWQRDDPRAAHRIVGGLLPQPAL